MSWLLWSPHSEKDLHLGEAFSVCFIFFLYTLISLPQSKNIHVLSCLAMDCQPDLKIISKIINSQWEKKVPATKISFFGRSYIKY